MEEFDSPSTHSHLHPHQPFTVGSEVEVTINEEGFRGALFRATILKLRTSIFPSKKKKAVVEYKTLVTEDGSNPLKEQVDVLSLRPIPPDTPDTAFEECDIVDAVDKDGWWTGVVCKVLENGGYSVFFKNPMHVMDFQRNQLRLHQDWIADKWVVLQKMGASILKDQLAAIFTDTNIPENVQSGSLKNAETNNEKESSYSINSRNDLVEPPSICDKNYASFSLASTKRRRSLSSKSRISDPVKKLGGGNVPGVPTADGLKKTDSTSSRGKSFSKNSILKRDRKRRIYQNFHCDSDSDLSDKFKSPKGAMEARTKKNVDGSDELKEQGEKFINDNRGNTFERGHCTQTTDKDGKEDCDVLETTPKEVSTNNESERNKHLASEEKQMTPTSIHLPDEVRGVEENSNNKTKEKGMEPEQHQATENSSKRMRGRPRKFMQELDQQQPSKNSYKRKRGRPRKLMLVPTTAEDNEQDGLGWKPDTETTKSCVTDFPDLNRNLNELLAYKTNDIGTKSASSNIDDDDDRPLLMWLGGMQEVGQTSGSTAKWKRNGSEQVNGVNEVRTVDGTPDRALDKNQGWPFVKSSPVWSAIDALEVFKQIPQTPHFHPLCTSNELSREGLAIGCMATFANLVEKISKLQFDNPRQVFESTLAGLSELEEHGFNISILYNRVNELLCIKDSQMRYLEESKEAENKILEHTENKTKLAQEIKAMEQKIEDMQKRRSSFKLEMETKDVEITRLQSYVETIRECIEDTKQHFENQTALPLKPV